MLSWADAFCEPLAAGPRVVIRYDGRDGGRSVMYAPAAPRYALRDRVTDALGLLDALGVARARLVGMSLGGEIAQLMAVEHPERVASLTLASTTPAARAASSRTSPGRRRTWTRRAAHPRRSGARVRPARELWDRVVSAVIRHPSGAPGAAAHEHAA